MSGLLGMFGINASHQSSSMTDLLSQIFEQASKQQQTTSGTTTGTTAGTTTGTETGTTARVLTPQQQAAQESLAKTISQISTNPQAFLAPAQNQAREGVNQNYSGLADNLRQQFLSGSGGGASGKYGTAALTGDLARRGALSNVDTTFGAAAGMLPITGAGLAQQFLGTNLGQTSAGTQTGATTGTTAGTTAGTTETTGEASGTSSSTEKKTGSGTGFGIGAGAGSKGIL